MIEIKKLSEINEYEGTSVNPLDTPEEKFELYSVPSFDNQHPEIIKGKEIGSTKITIEENDVLICKINPRINRVWVVKHNTNHRLLASSEWIVVRNHNLNSGYLQWYFSSPSFRKMITSHVAGIGGSLTRAQPKVVANYPIPIPSLQEQERIASVLNKIENMISSRKKQLQKLGDLVKARFVEMFGEPVHNSTNLPALPMTDVCAIIDGDRGKNYPKQEEFFDEEYCLFLNAKNVTSHGFDFSECMFITKEKDLALRKGKLKRGDVVLTTRGTLGNLALYTDNVPYENVRINSGMVILRMNKQIIDERFFIEQFRMQVDEIKKSIASGSAQPQLPISIMNKINILMPELFQQKQFTTFVSQIDKSKLSIQQSLEKLETLKLSLMQQYFG